jgi:hypothetical protein
MPHEDYGSPLPPPDITSDVADSELDSPADDAPDDAIDAIETDMLLDVGPRERSSTTAVPLNLPRRRFFVSRSREEVEDTEDEDEDGDGGWDDEDTVTSIAPIAAPETMRLEALSLTTVPQVAVVPAIVEPPAPVVIPGVRRLRRMPKHPFIIRRARPLMVGMLAFTIIAALVISGLVIATPLASVLAANGGNPLISAAGAVSVVDGVRFTWYTARWGDSPETLAQNFHVALGGIYELNHLYAGDELLIGRAYKIPADPAYGERYTPPAMLNVTAHYGDKRYGPNWWDSIAGTPPSDSPCAPNGGANELAYQLQPPNWGARWVRGYIVYGTWVYHTGVDLAAPQGNVIHAAQAGQVIWAGYDATNGLGWSVKIDHCNHVSTVYGHMMRILVQAGDYVDAGAPVGLEGSTGNSTGPHLHFMVEWNNLWVNPMLFYSSRASIIGPP